MIKLIDWLRQGWRKSLTRRLLYSHIAISFLSLILLGIFSGNLVQNAIHEQVDQRNDKLAQLIAADIEAEFENIWNNLRLFTNHLPDVTHRLTVQAQSMIDFRQIAPLTYRALYLFDVDGELSIHLADPLDDLLKIKDASEVINRPKISLSEDVIRAKKAAQGGEVFISPVSIVGADRVPVVFTGFQISPENTGASQVIVAEIDLRNIWRRIDETSIGTTGYTYVISHEGIVIAHPLRDRVGLKANACFFPSLNGYQGHVTYEDSTDGSMHFASYSPVGGASGWGVVVEQDQSEVFESITPLRLMIVGFLLLTIVLSTSITVIISRSIVRPMQNLVQVTQRIANTQNLNESILVEGDDEVAHLAGAFNEMVTSLREMQSALQTYSGSLEEKVDLRTRELRRTQDLLFRHATDLEFAIKELESFSYSVSHDLRAPLRAIDGYVSIISSDYGAQLPPEAHEMMERIHRNIHHMSLLINGLLDLARTGRQQLNMEPLKMSDIADQVVNQLKMKISGRQVEFIIHDLPIWRADESLIRQVFVNLVSNAIKFTRDREVGQIEIGGRVENGMAICYIRDNGIGFDMRYSERLFRAFNQMHQNRDFEGIGIGLAIVKRIIQRHSGKVWAESIPDQGATFYFSLGSSTQPQVEITN